MHRINRAVERAQQRSQYGFHDGDVVASVGYGGNGTPDQLFVALEKPYFSGMHPPIQKELAS